jgi:hypothetical protein
MRIFLAAAVMIAAAIGPAYAQSKKSGGGANTQLPLLEEERQKQAKEVDRAYGEAMKRTQKNAKPYDPWQSVRSPSTPAGKN